MGICDPQSTFRDSKVIGFLLFYAVAALTLLKNNFILGEAWAF